MNRPKRDRPATRSVRAAILITLPPGVYYEMYLTNSGHIAGSCGVFRTDGGVSVIHLNLPYTLGGCSGWLIRRRHQDTASSPTLLTTEDQS